MEIKPYREVTVEAVILGLIVGVIMTVAFSYAGLLMGFSLVGSTVAAIIGWGVLRGILRKGSIVENNINQTIASGVNVGSAGVIFTVPALYLLGLDFSIFGAAIACIAGSLIGVAFIIPLRKQMIDIERLRFPSGMAVATILKSPGAGVQKSVLLALGIAVSAVIALITVAPALGWIGKTLIPDKIDVGKLLGMPGYVMNIWALSLVALGAGFITGKAGLLVLVGGILANWIIIPVAVGAQWYPAKFEVAKHAGEIYGHLYSTVTRPMGIGMLVGGALMGIVVAFPSIRAAFTSLNRASKRGDGIKSEELPVKFVYLAAVLAFILILLVTKFLSGYSLIHSLGMAVAGVAWIWLAGIIVAQCTGMTDWSPLSGLALIGVTIVLLIGMSGGGDPKIAIIPAVLIGAATCLAAGQCADMMQDLKTGFVVGAKPIRQQTLQVCVTWLGPIIALIIIAVLWKAGPDGKNGFGPGSKNLKAPQADALADVIAAFTKIERPVIETKPAAAEKGKEKAADAKPEGAQDKAEKKTAAEGDADKKKPDAKAEKKETQKVPYTKYLAGAIIAGLLSFSGIAGLGVLVGLSMYLPMKYILIYGVGCIIQMVLSKTKGRRWCEDFGVPVAAGFIVGEACVMCLFAFIKVASA
ncbi:MAG: peptide transporter [Planctomycetota bacterium]|nr:MAG: peptide transporter [Planctomycetota bacterium]